MGAREAGKFDKTVFFSALSLRAEKSAGYKTKVQKAPGARAPG